MRGLCDRGRQEREEKGESVEMSVRVKFCEYKVVSTRCKLGECKQHGSCSGMNDRIPVPLTIGLGLGMSS